MEHKKGFILAAGYGSRMKKIGKVLPKILWPIFEKNILQLQILYLKELGVEKIFMNTHHLSDKIQFFVEKEKLDIHILHEKELLGTGGCFHNFKEKVGNDRILSINGDQFYFAPSLANWHTLTGTTLLATVVADPRYSNLITDKCLLKGIEKKSRDRRCLTFCGVSIIDLKNMNLVRGRSDFFHSVANYRETDIYVHRDNLGVYYDFGTLDCYVDSLRKIIEKYEKGQRDFFIDFLERNAALDQSKMGKDSYGSGRQGEIIFENGFTMTRSQISYRDIREML